MVIGRRDTAAYGGVAYEASNDTGVVLDDCNFHEAANLENFDIDR